VTASRISNSWKSHNVPPAVCLHETKKKNCSSPFWEMKKLIEKKDIPIVKSTGSVKRLKGGKKKPLTVLYGDNEGTNQPGELKVERGK